MTAPILPGAEPFSHDGGPEGVLVMHGFTGNPQSMRPLADALADAGWSVSLPLWPGHGTAVEHMVPTRFEDWSAAAEAAYQDLHARCDAVALVGLSMGGALACWLAQRHPEVRGLVLINPLVEPPGDDMLGAIRQLLDDGVEIAPGIGSDIAKPGAVELAYDGSPLRAALSMFEHAAHIRDGLHRISCPVLLLSSRQDHVVDPASGDRVLEQVAGPVERVWLEHSYHVATLDHDADEVTARTIDFVAQALSRQGSA